MHRIESKRTPLVMGLALLLATSARGQEAFDERCAALKSELPKLLEHAETPGLAIAIARREGVVWSAESGTRDAGKGTDVDRETVFEAASLSKPVFAWVALQLVDEGVLELDEPLSSYAPLADLAHDPRHERLTTRMVLSHTTGLPNWRPQGGRLEFLADPGTRWGYSGEGFVLLQRVVEHLTASTLEEVARDLVFEPFGMERTSYVWREGFAGNLASAHDDTQTPFEKERLGAGNAAYSLLTTAADYARFLAAVLCGERLSSELQRALAEPQTEVAPGVGWGLGWGHEDNPDGVALWHWGHNGGFRAYTIAYPSRDLALVFFTNGDNGMLLLRDVVRLATGEEDHPALVHLDYDSHDDPGPRVTKELARAIREEGVEVGIATYFELRELHPPEAFDERLLNTLGYGLLNGEPARVEDALQIFRFNVELYPDASNPYDSLGEAYRVAGQLERSLASYERSVHLDASNENGRAQIVELRELLKASPRAAASTAESEGAALSRRVAAFDDSLDPVNRLSGVLLVARGDELLLHEAYGLADVELGVPNTTQTRFCIASITKVMTNLIAWQLLVEGKLTRGSTLQRFIPDFPRGDEITVDHLLRHRAGLPHRVTDPSESWRPLTAAEVTERAKDHELLFEPGSRSVYSSAGYSVLARVIELVEGDPFAEVLRRRILEPAGMNDTFDVDGRTLLAGRARSYVPGRDTLLRAPLQDLSFLVGAGSVVSTAADLRRFVQAYKSGVYGAPAWGVTQGIGPAKWTGASNGFHAFLDFDPEDDTLFVYTGNSFGGGAGQLRSALTRLAAGEDVRGEPRPEATVTVAPERLREYVGRYRSRPGAFWKVSLRGSELMIADSVVLPLSDTEFYFQNWAKPLTFVRESEDAPWALSSRDWNGQEQIWPRAEFD